MPDKQRLRPEGGLDRLTRLDRGKIHLRRSKRQHVGAGVHLIDQRYDHRDRTHPGKAHRSDVDEIATTNTVAAASIGDGCPLTLQMFNDRHAPQPLQERPWPRRIARYGYVIRRAAAPMQMGTPFPWRGLQA